MSDDLPYWVLELIYGPDDHYQRQTNAFVIKTGLSEDEVDIHFEKIHEEIGEVEEAYEEYEIHGGRRIEHLGEEIADGIHSLFVLASMLDIDVKEHFDRKAMANLNAASPERDEDGFVKWDGER